MIILISSISTWSSYSSQYNNLIHIPTNRPQSDALTYLSVNEAVSSQHWSTTLSRLSSSFSSFYYPSLLMCLLHNGSRFNPALVGRSDQRHFTLPFRILPGSPVITGMFSTKCAQMRPSSIRVAFYTNLVPLF